MNGSGINWETIRLVVFDVDGTLYNQRALRLRMLKELISFTIASRSLQTLRILRDYRKLRETIGEKEVDGFEDVLIALTSEKTGVESEKVELIVQEWIERRPLAHMLACRRLHIVELFAALKKLNKVIGIFSDYPAMEKLCALGLEADIVVSATDKEVGILKPNPRGLTAIMAAAGVGPQETILIGDRPERDGEAALRAGVAALILSNKPIKGWLCFPHYAGPQFSPLFDK